MAAAESQKCPSKTTPNAKAGDAADGVLRTAGIKTAAIAEKRRQQTLINTNQRDQKRAHGDGDAVVNRVWQNLASSSATCVYTTCPTLGLAMITKSMPAGTLRL